MPNPAQTRTELIVIQATPFCNVNCRYCYLHSRSSTKRVTYQTLERIFAFLFAQLQLADPVSIVWHAGEPLVLPRSFYENVFRLAEQHNRQGLRVMRCFQTNGTLIDQDWCDFLKRHNVKVGVSLDGPQHIHDAERLDRAGQGTFERTMRGITLLQQNALHPSIISVLTEYALDYPDEIWQFFREHRLTHLAFNVEEIEGMHTQSSLATESSFTHYKRFLRFSLNYASTVRLPPSCESLTLLSAW